MAESSCKPLYELAWSLWDFGMAGGDLQQSLGTFHILASGPPLGAALTAVGQRGWGWGTWFQRLQNANPSPFLPQSLPSWIHLANIQQWFRSGLPTMLLCTSCPTATTTGDPRDGPRWSATLLMVVLKNACSYTPRSLSIWRCLQPTEENVMKSRSAKGFG